MARLHTMSVKTSFTKLWTRSRIDCRRFHNHCRSIALSVVDNDVVVICDMRAVCLFDFHSLLLIS